MGWKPATFVFWYELNRSQTSQPVIHRNVFLDLNWANGDICNTLTPQTMARKNQYAADSLSEK